MTASFSDLMNELGELNVRDDHALIGWLLRAFTKAHDDKVDELPERGEVARLISQGRGIQPNPRLSAEPPSHEPGNADLAAWLIQRALNLAHTSPSGPVPLRLNYRYFAEAALDYLGRE